MRHLSEPTAEDLASGMDWGFLGRQLDTATARSVCEGFAHPDTYAPYPADPSPDARLFRGGVPSAGWLPHSCLGWEGGGWGRTRSVLSPAIPSTAF